MIHPVNIPDVFTSAPSDDEGNPFGRRASINRAASPINYAADGRKLLIGNEATDQQHISTLWTRTLRGSFLNRLRDGSLKQDVTATNTLSRSSSDDKDDADRTDGSCGDTSFEVSDSPTLDVHVDLMISENAVSHHTNMFDIVNRSNQPQLVIRRGQIFKLSLSLDRDFDPKTDKIALIFQFGKYGTESRGTRVCLPVKDVCATGGWKIDSSTIKDRQTTLQIQAPSTCMVGVWMLEVRTTYIGDRLTRDTLSGVGAVYMLFNPWCHNDAVFMQNASDRAEYVLNDLGRIWKGGHNVPLPTDWIFGQFEDGVIETSMLLLDRAVTNAPQRCSPVQVCRAISSLTNANDDDGVLEGRWKGPFDGGIHPSAWTGSAAILREYAATGHAVKYGQCPTFAGVFCTVMRCIGVPCRVVTNYSSAHDTDTSCTIDYHYSLTTNRPMDEYNEDTVWNFHCWNDCWMDRSDLPRGYSGWQAVDATPMQRSQGLYRMGPASVRAVKEGEIGFAHDTPFVFAEVNADHCEWLVDEKRKSMKLIQIVTDKIGKMILTKRPGNHARGSSNEIHDVTSDYKHPEMTPEERSAVLNALFTGQSAALNYSANANENTKKDVSFVLKLDDKATVGHDFTVTLIVTNSSEEARKVKISMVARSSSYTGVALHMIKNEYKLLSLQPGQEERIVLPVQFEEYVDKMSEDASFLISVMAHVPDTGQIYSQTDDFQLLHSSIQMLLAEEMNLSEPYEVVIKMRNPLGRMLTGCQFTAEGPGISQPRKFKCQNMPARTVASVKFSVKPWAVGDKILLANFTSDQIVNVQGIADINVK